MDEQRRVRLGERFRDDVKQGKSFDVTVCAEASGDAIEVGVVVSGMTDKLPGSRREVMEQMGQDAFV